MATIVKPKQKKKKTIEPSHEKQKKRLPSEIEFPSTSTRCYDITSYDCSVSSEFFLAQSNSLNSTENLNKITLDEEKLVEVFEAADAAKSILQEDNHERKKEDSQRNTNTESDDKKTNTNKEDALLKAAEDEKHEVSTNEAESVNELNTNSSSVCKSDHEEKQETVVPSAPVINLKSTKISSPNISVVPTKVSSPAYPDLSKIRIQESNTTVKFQLSNTIKLQPFTDLQLQEIYSCKEIEFAKQFEADFLSNVHDESFSHHNLYQLLINFMNIRSKLKLNNTDLIDLKKRFKDAEPNIWSFTYMESRGSGKCADNNTVQVRQTYQTAVLNAKDFQVACSNLKQIHQLVCYSYSINVVQSEIAKLRVEQAIDEILNYPLFQSINSSTPLRIIGEPNGVLMTCLNHLRTAISILFIFVRRPSPDKEFRECIKKWLQQLIALLLRTATYRDHLFILFHILRCPNGISSWATEFIQLPFSKPSEQLETFSNPEVNHCVAFLSILLMPIKKRNDFLKPYLQPRKEISDPVNDDVWILVDSEGEETSSNDGECFGLKANDFTLFLNQVPFEKIFCSVLNIHKASDTYTIPNDCLSANQLVKIIAFSNYLTWIFGNGLITYNTEKYKQFAKSLGRLIRHNIQYIADYYELYIRNGMSKDPYICERLSIEFDNFVIKSCCYIYKTRNLGTWQYFISIPFGRLNISTTWKLFYCLNVGFCDVIISDNNDFEQLINTERFWKQFNEVATEISADDLYYLLQTFLGMVLERDHLQDMLFIKTVCLHVFNIGFINKETKDICYKTSKDMLESMTSIYPELISDLIGQIKSKPEAMENAIYLFQSLPLHKWKPEMENLNTIALWLLNFSFEKRENILARIIIAHLNWDFDENDELFLPYDLHFRTACLINDALNKHAPETVGYSGTSESVREMSTLSESQSPREKFVTWCWNIISTLHLHQIDQNYSTVINLLQNPGAHINQIMELEQIDKLCESVAESRPLAIYVSILVSLIGHSLPLICQRGFAHMQMLIKDYRHAIVIRCLDLITPIFFECPEVLCKLEIFQNILKQLLNADRTYVKMAKDLISSSQHGPVLKLLGNMIQSQIINYTKFGLSTPTPIISLWLQCLSHIPGWHTPNVFHLIDLILKIAYQFADSWYLCKEYLRDLYKDVESSKNTKPSALKALFGYSYADNVIPVPSPVTPWFSLLNLELEHEIRELQTNFWPELLRQIYAARKKFNFDTVIRRTSSVVGCSNYSVNSLVLFKYANFISDMTVDDPLLPILSQKFFTLYLARIPFLSDVNERFSNEYGVANKFYESNITLMKKLKVKFKKAEEYYTEVSQKHFGDEPLMFFFLSCSSIFNTYNLWLEETRINNISKNIEETLPSQYNISKLRCIFTGNTEHWTEFLHLPNIRKTQTDCSNKWLKSCCRFKSPKKSVLDRTSSLRMKKNPIDRIKQHLESYDTPLPPPKLIKKNMQSIQKPILISSNTFQMLQKQFKLFEDYAKQFNSVCSELNSLNCIYKDSMQILYENVNFHVNKFASCGSNCKGSTKIEIKISEPQKNVNIERKIENNRERHDALLDYQITKKYDKLIEVMEDIENTIKYFIACISDTESKMTDSKSAVQISIQLFYELINRMDENILSYAITKEIFRKFISQLGVIIQENQETQGIRILELALKRPELIDVISELFVPSRIVPEFFINLYKYLIDSHLRRCDSKILFVLISKFDMHNWLKNFKPKLAELNMLIQLIVRGLYCWNQKDSNLIQDLFRRHLVHIFEYDFPEHYGEIIELVLCAASQQNISPIVIMDLLNSLLLRCGCNSIELNSKPDKYKKDIVKFAKQQNLFNFKSITDTMSLLAKYFQKERLQHGLHGLYPKHKAYCGPLSTFFSCLGHACIVSAVYSYPGLLADKICDCIFPHLVELYAPWLIAYSGQSLQQSTSNWIKQLISTGKILLPWSELHVDSAQEMLLSFVYCMQFVLDTLPVSNLVLVHIFSWYDFHFAQPQITKYILTSTHSALSYLTWTRFQPQMHNIESMCKILQECLPECHAFLGRIFLQINWNDWIKNYFQNWNQTTQTSAIGYLLQIFVKIAFEPNVRDSNQINIILKDSLEFPWSMVEHQSVENILNWVMISIEPAIVLKLQSDRSSIDITVLDLLKLSSGMIPNTNHTGSNHSEVQWKRILYVRTIIRLIKECEVKHQQLISTKLGVKAIENALMELIASIEVIVNDSENGKRGDIEAQNLMTEILISIQVQSKFMSKLFFETIIIWQSRCNIGSLVLCNTLNVIGNSKVFVPDMYGLLEATIFNYFRTSDECKSDHFPTWNSVIQRLSHCFAQMDMLMLINGSFLLSLHSYIVYKLNIIENYENRALFLQDLMQLIEGIKIKENIVSQMAIIWGVIIKSGCQLLEKTQNAKKSLLMLARYLQTVSNQNEGWGEGLLGAIGLKKDSVSNNRKILTRCLSALIFSLFHDKTSSSKVIPNQEYIVCLNELKTISASKKFSDIRLLATKAIQIVENNTENNTIQLIDKVHSIILLFYSDNFLSSLKETWLKT